MALGIDISLYNGPVNLATAKQRGAQFCILRSSIGTIEDARFQINVANGVSAGMPLMTYHAFIPGRPIADQVELHVRLANMIPERVRLNRNWLDCEVEGAYLPPAYTSLVQAYFMQYEIRHNSNLGIYTRATWWNVHTVPNIYLERKPLLVAHYGAADPTLPRGFTKYEGWQFSADNNSLGHFFGGSSSDMDLDYFVEDVPPVPPPPPALYPYPVRVDTYSLNVRLAPTVNGLRIGAVPRNTRLEVWDEEGDWLRVAAWVHGDYVVRI